MHISDLESAVCTFERRVPAPAGASSALDLPAVSQVEPVLGALLDELDYGLVLLLRESARVVFINHEARTQMRDGHGICVEEGVLRPCHDADAQPLADAIGAARRGHRRLVTLGLDGGRATVAFIPVSVSPPDGQALVAAVFGRRRLCGQLSVEWFARAHGLTPAETRVVELLCEGLDPRDIAALNGREISTVRTQVNSIREKTGAASIRSLLQRLATLPPMMSVLRC